MERKIEAAQLKARQAEYIRRIKEIDSRPRTYHIVTYGCQMNAHDSEKLAGMLKGMDMTEALRREEADFVIFNTCCVRENAENRALGNVLWLNTIKKKRPEMLVAVCGCMMQQPGMADRVRKQYKFIDLVFGTHNLHELPQLLHRQLTTRSAVIEVIRADGEIAEGVPVSRANAHSAYTTVMYGCDNFCAYCIVPHVRGRERSRRVEDILDEARLLRDSGVKEITLLGQNVNSYGRGLENGISFAQLLGKLDALGIPRIRFMTSHPKDLSDELIEAYAGLKSLCPHLHLPVQSGSDEILRQMNRGYTVKGYLDLVEKLRRAAPQVGLTTDIIVGFPGETRAQFEETLDLVKRVRYDSAYTFIYSKRPGTAAARLEDGISPEEKSGRIGELIEVQQGISEEIMAEMVGSTQSVLIEGISARGTGSVSGKTGRSIMVNLPGEESLIGKIVDVRITAARRSTLRGEMA